MKNNWLEDNWKTGPYGNKTKDYECHLIRLQKKADTRWTCVIDGKFIGVFGSEDDAKQAAWKNIFGD